MAWRSLEVKIGISEQDVLYSTKRQVFKEGQDAASKTWPFPAHNQICLLSEDNSNRGTYNR